MNLSLLGLSDYEEKAYRTLVRLGKVSASEISRESNVSYGKIYEVLGRLETKGLVQVIPETTKKFLATNPDSLIKLIEDKQKEFELMKKEAEKLKQEYTYGEEDPVQIARGKRNFPRIIHSLNDKERQFSYSLKWAVDIKPSYMERNKKDLKKGIPIKTLTTIRDDNKANIKKWLKVDPNFREFENKGIVLDITNDHVLIVFVNKNIIMTIKDEAFIDVMKRMFENTYNVCEPITEKNTYL